MDCVPDHTCESIFIKTVKDGEITIVRHTARHWRNRRCEGCYDDRVHRLCMQIEQESSVKLYWSEIERTTKQLVNKMRKWRTRYNLIIRYRILPLENNIIIIHDHPDRLGGQPLPADKAKLRGLIEIWADTPEGKRISAIEGWGGCWQRMSGNSNR